MSTGKKTAQLESRTVRRDRIESRKLGALRARARPAKQFAKTRLSKGRRVALARVPRTDSLYSERTSRRRSDSNPRSEIDRRVSVVPSRIHSESLSPSSSPSIASLTQSRGRPSISVRDASFPREFRVLYSLERASELTENDEVRATQQREQFFDSPPNAKQLVDVRGREREKISRALVQPSVCPTTR